MTLRFPLMAVTLAAFLFAASGCADNKLKAERDSLVNQNKDLTEKLAAESAARQAADAKASAMGTQLTAAPTESSVPSMTGGGPLELTGPVGRTSARPTTTVRSTTPVSRAVAPTRVKIPGEVLFDSGKTSLSAAATKTLDTMAATIKKSYSGDKVVIEGFTDSTPVKNPALKSNEALAAARATSVMKYLAKKGIPEKDMSVKAMGAADPKSTTNLAANRRVEVAILK